MPPRSSIHCKGLESAPIEKDAFIAFAIERLNLEPTCSILDLDNPIVLSQPLIYAQLGIWLDTWTELVCAPWVGSCDDSEIGIAQARAMLGEVADHVDYLLFSADFNRPPLDQFRKGERLLFERSTGLEAKELATYKGRIVFVGSKKI